MPSTSAHLERLIALADEAEQLLARSIASHDIRHACAVARGYLDLARSYNEPVNIEDVERVLERMRELLRLSRPNSTTKAPREPALAQSAGLTGSR
jgi:signal transduction histidine kinase